MDMSNMAGEGWGVRSVEMIGENEYALELDTIEGFIEFVQVVDLGNGFDVKINDEPIVWICGDLETYLRQRLDVEA